MNTPGTMGGPVGRYQTGCTKKKYIGENKCSASGVFPKWVKSKRHKRKKERGERERKTESW